ncbi:MAG: alpha-L-rhamnosidase [Planctomycetota bacterium]|nr:MAG: alpha-L-rhamnosidase [Planctomycetota bacterium]
MKKAKIVQTIRLFCLLAVISGCQTDNATSPGTTALAKGLTPAYLRCEHLLNPLGIDKTRPRLSWIVESAQRGRKQTAYRILVAGSEENIKADRGDLWDSGKIESDETKYVFYSGTPLNSHTQCYWKVMVWDRYDRASGWSEPAMWTMGLLKPGDWRGRWIGYNTRDLKPEKEAGEEDSSGKPVVDSGKGDKNKLVLPRPAYMRKEFTLEKPVRRAVLYSTALGIYEMHINGHRVGKDYFTPGWTDYDKRIYYNTYDVTGMLRRTDNTIGAIVADGWYSGYIGWGKKRDHYGKQPRLLAQLYLEYTDGSTEVITTDESWRASVGGLLEADFLMGETCDGRRRIAGWDEPGFEQAGWEAVSCFENTKAKLQSYPGPTVQIFSEMQPVKITEPKKDVHVFDMGTNFAGWARLRVKGGKAGDKIVLRYAERLNPDGTIYTKNLRGARATDTYICNGGGEEIWEPRFTYHGFQYVEVTGYPGKPSTDAITGIQITSATPPAGSFECSDEMINKLYRNICQTQRANFIDIPTDCPQRDERLGWTGDAQIYIRTACMNTDTHAFFTKWLADLADAQRADGQFPKVAPVKTAGNDGGPAWADAGIICPWTIYEVYGDKQILQKYYEGMARFIDFCKDRSTEELLPPRKYHCYGDWLNIEADTPKDVIYTCYFAHSTRLMSRIAQALGKDADFQKYSRLFERIKKAFNKAYVDDEGRIKGDTQCCYVMAICFDLLDPDRQDLAAGHLIDDIKSRNWHLSTGFVGTKDLMLALAKIGRNDVAYRLLHNDTFPSWGFSIRHGATSIWERWDGWTPEKGFHKPGMNSFAHYSFGAVGDWMFRTIGGIDTDGPGFKKIIIRPQPGGRLHWAKTSYNSINGKIATAWKIHDGTLSLNVTIPANTTATVYVPAVSAEDVTESGRPAAKSRYVKFIRMEDKAAVYEIGSGDYTFISRDFAGSSIKQ